MNRGKKIKKLTLEITLTEEQFEEIKKINNDYESGYTCDRKQLDQNLLWKILSKNIEKETNQDNLIFLKHINKYTSKRNTYVKSVIDWSDYVYKAIIKEIKQLKDQEMTIGEYLNLEIFFEQYLADGTYTYSYEEACYLLADYDNELPEDYVPGDYETTEQKFLNYLFEAYIDRLQDHKEYTIEEFIDEYK